MNRFFAIALCVLFAIHSAEARTIYVNAKRPNNNGNGLSVKKAKKTIQAAINIAKKGDTILVYPGTYAPIKTNNRKITIKSVKGQGQTVIRREDSGNTILANLGSWWRGWDHWSVPGSKNKGYIRGGGTRFMAFSDRLKNSTASSLSGFTLQGRSYYDEGGDAAVAGGVLKSCKIDQCGRYRSQIVYVRAASGSKPYSTESHPTILCSKLTECTIAGCEGGFIEWYSADEFSRTREIGKQTPESGLAICESTLVRCKLIQNFGGTFYRGQYSTILRINDSKLCNCLFAGNERLGIDKCVLLNCTVADNTQLSISATKADNTIFNGIATSQFKKAKKNTLKNCYRGPNPKFISTQSKTKTWVASDSGSESRIVGAEVFWNLYDNNNNRQDGGSVIAYGTTDEEILAATKVQVGLPDAEYYIFSRNYEYGDYKTETVPGDYRLKKGSPCINSGKLTKAQKKFVGTKDLAGKKRINGKAIDMGCYEY